MYGVNGINVTPCGANNWGETEDYIITIGSSPVCPSPGIMFLDYVNNTTAQLKLPLTCSNATVFDLEYDTLGFVLGNGTQLSTNTCNIQ